MRSFLSIAMGFLVTLGVAEVGYAEPETGSADVGHIETSSGTIALVPVNIDGVYYYRLETDNKDNALKPEDVRKTVARYDSILPKAFRSDAGIVSKIVTEAEETKLQDAAKEARKQARKSKKDAQNPFKIGLHTCCCCGHAYPPPCVVCSCQYPRAKQKEVDKKFKKWKREHCSPLPERERYRNVCEMDVLDQKTQKGRWGWRVITSEC